MSVPDRAPVGCLAAVLAAAAVPVIPMPLLLLFSLPIAALHALVIGIPLYAFLARRRRPGAALTLAGGFAVGALPALLLVALIGPPPMDAAGALLGGSESGPVLWAQWGRWGEYFAAPLFFGGCGLIGGMVFWLVVRGDVED
jgi:hypothetical protein